jgi:hypothetical protein
LVICYLRYASTVTKRLKKRLEGEGAALVYAPEFRRGEP